MMRLLKDSPPDAMVSVPAVPSKMTVEVVVEVQHDSGDRQGDDSNPWVFDGCVVESRPTQILSDAGKIFIQAGVVLVGSADGLP